MSRSSVSRRSALRPRCAFPLAALLVLFAGSPAHAATFTVDSTLDAVDASLGDGICATAAATCTLRAAIQEANHSPGGDVVSLPAGTYTLTIAGTGEDESATGDLDIRGEDSLTGGVPSGGVEIAGAGAATTIIDGNDLDGVLHVVSSSGFNRADIHDVTIRNGVTGIRGAGFGVFVHDTDVVDNTGVGISVTALNSALVAERCQVLRNGGGIQAITFTAEIVDTTISDNTGTGLTVKTSGPGMHVEGVRITGNQAPSCGGMLISWGGNTGAPSLRDITLTGNKATAGDGGGACIAIVSTWSMSALVATENEATGNGGAIVSTESLSKMQLGGVDLRNNTAGGSGGAIYAVGGGARLQGSRIEGNDAGVDGGGIAIAGHGRTSDELRVESSSVTGNTAVGDGGGIHVPEGLPTLIVNSTIAGNTAGGNGGGILVTDAPAVPTNLLRVTLEHATIAGNDADGAGGGIYVFHPSPPPAPNLALPRGLAPADEPSLVVNDSIIGDNTAADGADCSTNVGMTASAYNLIEETDGCLVSADVHSFFGVDPALAPLANEGGPTLVHRLLPASQAIDTANPTCAVATDQRGVARPQGIRCDIGAYELACGNGVVDADIGETCDDGNRVGEDCCSPTCTLDADGAPCKDQDDCTTGDTCDGGVCTAGTTPVSCPACETCLPDGGCIAAPRGDCRQQTVGLGGQLEIVDQTTDRLTWTWSKGAATTLADFGDPIGGDSYAVCLFDQADSKILWRGVTRSGQCGNRPCWKQTTQSTLRYKDPTRGPDGIDSVFLKRGADGKARLFVRANGPSFDPPALPLPLPARMQLQAENGRCWEAPFSETGTSKNDTVRFRAKAFRPIP